MDENKAMRIDVLQLLGVVLMFYSGICILLVKMAGNYEYRTISFMMAVVGLVLIIGEDVIIECRRLKNRK